MKSLKHIVALFAVVVFLFSCSKEAYLGDVTDAPAGVQKVSRGDIILENSGLPEQQAAGTGDVVSDNDTDPKGESISDDDDDESSDDKAGKKNKGSR